MIYHQFTMTAASPAVVNENAAPLWCGSAWTVYGSKVLRSFATYRLYAYACRTQRILS